ncbi:MAG TPA: cistern family PEP-CTERM protein [Bryobacteraceae bacterium]|nr:cistern family PEP-CTERM protein [Bryobacteraceae bacterium]
MNTLRLHFPAILMAGLCVFTGLAAAAPITLTSASNVLINFDGSGGVPVQLVNGLSAQLHLYGFSFNTGTGSHAGETLVEFSFDVANTSSSPVVSSRITGVGFNTTPDLVDTADNGVNGVFENIVMAPTFPNSIGTVDFCFTTQSCPGGGNGGVAKGATSTGNTASLYFTGSITQLTLDNTYVRYLSLSCPTGTDCPPSATGVGTLVTTSDSTVPEPSTYALFALGLAGIAGAKRKNWIR